MSQPCSTRGIERPGLILSYRHASWTWLVLTANVGAEHPVMQCQWWGSLSFDKSYNVMTDSWTGDEVRKTDC